LVPVLFTFYIQGVLKLRKNNFGATRLIRLFTVKYSYRSLEPIYYLWPGIISSLVVLKHVNIFQASHLSLPLGCACSSWFVSTGTGTGLSSTPLQYHFTNAPYLTTSSLGRTIGSLGVAFPVTQVVT